MRLYNLGKVPWHESQLIYHALAALGREALSLVSPGKPYVCIGFHQDVEHEVDLDFCEANDIPVFRREVGGGSCLPGRQSAFFSIDTSKR
jgi:lipoate-protein ligase A